MHARLVDRSGGSSTDRHRCMRTLMGNSPQPSASARSGATLPLINQHPRWRVRHSNPHSASRTLTVPIPRFRPLAVCVRRPSVYVAPSSWPASANVHNYGLRDHVRRTSVDPPIPEGNAAAPKTSASCRFCCKSPGGASAASALRRRRKYDSSRCRCEELRFFELSRLGLGFYPWTLR
jgi:hypothetical protein